MKLKISFLSLAIILLMSSAQAQMVRVIYDVIPLSEDRHTVQVFMQSMSEQEVVLRGANLSLAHLPTVEVKMVQKTNFVGLWSEYLQNEQVEKSLALNYEQQSYAHRLQYGNADPGLPNTEALTVPAVGDDPILVMEVVLVGEGSGTVYLEHEVENPLNQLGDVNMQPIDYVIERPQRNVLDPGDPSIAQDFILYPNPVTSHVNIKLEGVWEGQYQFRIYDMHGRMLLEGPVSEALQGDEMSITLDNWAEGTYLVNVYSPSGESFTHKFVKNN